MGALTQFGIADLAVYVDRFSEKPGFSRVIEIPLEVKTGTVEIFSVDSADSPELVAMEQGRYKVVVAQQLLDEDDLDGGKELIEIYFERTDNFFDKSRIIIGAAIELANISEIPILMLKVGFTAKVLSAC